MRCAKRRVRSAVSGDHRWRSKPGHHSRNENWTLLVHTFVTMFWHCYSYSCSLLTKGIIPQQCKLMGSSAQISSGVCRCGSQEQVPEEGSGRFRVPECAGVGSGGGFRKVPESSFVKWCKFRRQVPEGSGEFRCKMAQVPEASSGRFRRVPVYSEGSGKFRCGLLPCNLEGAAMWLFWSRG